MRVKGWQLFLRPSAREGGRNEVTKGTKPGQPAPDSGQYRPAGPSGKPVPGSTETTAVEGKPMPPTPHPDQTWVRVDKTKHKR